MKNVLSIAPYTFLPASSGGQRAILHLYKHLANYVHLTCVSTKDNNIEAAAGFSILPLFGSSKLRYINPFYIFKLKRIIATEKIDTLLLEHPYMGIFAWVLQKICHKRLIIRSHNIEALRFKELGKSWWKLLWYYERWVHRCADFSFFITREDELFAQQHYGLSPEKTAVITYGMELDQTISLAEKQQYTKAFKEEHGIAAQKTLLLFNGIFGYKPNDLALQMLREKILPELLQLDKDVCLIICGKNIPEAFQLSSATDEIVLLGFVPDISKVFRAAEIFLNPIWLGGGIKTKLVEALASGCAAVSFEHGAIGIPPGLLEGKLKIVPNQQTTSFVQAIIDQKQQLQKITPASFYRYFNWDSIARRAAAHC